MRRLSFLAVVLASLLLLSCGSGDGKSSEDFDAQSVLNQAAERMRSAKTFHFKLTHENGTTRMPLNLELVSADGDVAVPDRLKADVEGKALGSKINVQIVGIGDKTWITNPFSRQWQQLPGVAVREVADPAALVAAVATRMTDVRGHGREKVGGVDSYVIQGRVDSGVLRSAIGSAREGLSVDVHVWVGVDDKLPRRVRIEGPLSSSEGKSIVRVLELSKYDAAVDIRAPE